MHIGAKDQVQPERNAGRRAPDPAGQVHDEGTVAVDGDAGLGQLPREILGRRSVAMEERQRVLVVNEEVAWVPCRHVAARSERSGVVARVLDHRNAARAQPILLPGLCLRRHMHGGGEAQRRRHDADAEAEIAGRADTDFVERKGFARRRVGERGIVCVHEQAGGDGDALGDLQHRVEAAARLDGPRDRQGVIRLDHQPTAGAIQAERAPQHADVDQGRVDPAVCRYRLGEQPGEERSEPPEARACFSDRYSMFFHEVAQTRCVSACRIWPERRHTLPQTIGCCLW